MRSFQDFATRMPKDVKKTTGGDLNSEKMAPESSPDRSSPDPNCSICLSKMRDKSFTDRCFHMFCFECLVEWSKINAVCPLCKQPFKQIFHNIRDMSDYDVYDVSSHSSILPSISTQTVHNRAPIVVQPLLTNRHDVRMFLSQTTNEVNFREWLQGRIREYVTVDAMQAAFIANIVVDLLKVWHINSQEFYDSIVQFFTYQTLDFIHSIDHNLYMFMRQDSRDHSLENSLQRMRREATVIANPLVNIPSAMPNHRTIRSVTTSRHFIDGVLQSNSSNPSNPGPSRFSLLLSIFRPSGRSKNTQPASSSSSSPPREDELIDIERLENENASSAQAPICVSSGEENHVQLVECGSRSKTRLLRKRRQQTFLLVSSDDEAPSVVEGRKRIKVAKAELKSKSKSSSGSEVKVFKKHPTGHKNKIKSNVIGNRNEKSEEEKQGNLEQESTDGGLVADSVVPGSSSSQDVVDHLRNELQIMDNSTEKRSLDISNEESNQRFDSSHERSIVLDDSVVVEPRDDMPGIGEELIDVDAISLYSDDSIEWLEDVTNDSFLSNDPKADVEVVDASDVIVVSPPVDKRRQFDRKVRRKHLFVDLSDDDNTEVEDLPQTRPADDELVADARESTSRDNPFLEYCVNATTDNFSNPSEDDAASVGYSFDSEMKENSSAEQDETAENIFSL